MKKILLNATFVFILISSLSHEVYGATCTGARFPCECIRGSMNAEKAANKCTDFCKANGRNWLHWAKPSLCPSSYTTCLCDQ
jgi:hypothetical protein